jgi:hypothetical protein
MNFPFTSEQFLDVFKAYNLALWPAQIFLVVLALAAIFLAVYKTKFSDRVITLALTFYWLWIGIVYHLIFFTKINKAAYGFAALFLLQSGLFFYFGIIKHTLHFKYLNNVKGLSAIVMFLYSLIFYPLLGYSFGNIYPQTPTFGLPCPTTIFTFGLLLLSEGKINKILLIIPVLWAVIGFTAALKLGILQDIGLLVSAVLTLTVIIIERKNYQAV